MTTEIYAGLAIYVKDAPGIFNQINRFDSAILRMPHPEAAPKDVQKTLAFQTLNQHKDLFQTFGKRFPKGTPQDCDMADVLFVNINGHAMRKIVLPVITPDSATAYSVMHAAATFAKQIFGADLVSVKAKTVATDKSYTDAASIILVSARHQFAKTITVTEKNVQAVLRNVTLGSISLQNYNRDCFGTSDLKLADRSAQLLSNLVETIVDSGNSPFVIVEPFFKTVGYSCAPAFDPAEFAHITDVKPFAFEFAGGDVYDVCERIAGNVPDFSNLMKKKEVTSC